MLLRSKLKRKEGLTKTIRRQKPEEQSLQQEKLGKLPNHF